MDEKSRVFILLNENNEIIRLEGEYTLPSDLTDWILLEEGEPCDRLNLAQSHYLEKPLMDGDGLYNYRYEDGEIVEVTDKIIPEAFEEPTQLDRIEAQVMFTALMTDTLIEEV